MRLVFSICSILIIFALGCSGGSSPVTPDDSPAPELSIAAVNDGSGRILWGIWNVRIDPDAMTAEVTPLREASFTANVTQFMQPPLSPVHMVSFSIRPASDPAIGYFNVDVALRHPFPGLNMYNGFDVRGILLSDGSITGDHDSSVLRAGEDDTHLANADGYTRWWNYREFTSYETMFGATRGRLAPPNQPTATVNPYKYFALGLDPHSPVTDLDFNGRGFFPTVPGVHTRNYEIYFKMDGPQVIFDFQYAVDASWEDPDPAYEPEFPQEAFSLNANCREAFNLSVSDAGSTAYYIDPTDNGGELVLDIEVYDWQSLENPDGVPGEVSGLWLEGDILGGAVDVLPSATILPWLMITIRSHVASASLKIWVEKITALFSFVMVKNVLSMPATAQLAGNYLVWSVFWRGLVYGIVDGLLLSVFPFWVVWNMFNVGNKSLPSKFAFCLLVFIFVWLVTSSYHLGYKDFRSRKVVKANIGNTLISTPTIITANPLAAPLTHAAMHISAVLHSPETDLFLPPHR